MSEPLEMTDLSIDARISLLQSERGAVSFGSCAHEELVQAGLLAVDRRIAGNALLSLTPHGRVVANRLAASARLRGRGCITS